MALITKADFTPENFVKFSQNIREDQIEPYIYAAQENDLRPRLGDDLMIALQTATIDGSPQLFEFLTKYVKKYLVLASYYRFIAAHGMNVTQFGLSSTRDPQGTFDQVTPQDRAIILRQVQSDMNTALSRMMSQEFTFDTINFRKNEKAKQPVSMIRAPKRKPTGVTGYNRYFDANGNRLDSVVDELI